MGLHFGPVGWAAIFAAIVVIAFFALKKPKH